MFYVSECTEEKKISENLEIALKKKNKQNMRSNPLNTHEKKTTRLNCIFFFYDHEG